MVEMDDTTGLVEEYKSLKAEISKRQDARTIILGFTVAALGTATGATLRDNSAGMPNTNFFALALISFALMTVIAALIMTIHHTQQIDVIATYIRKFIEPYVPGMAYETRWLAYRETQRRRPNSGGLPLGTSKPLAVFYVTLTIAVYLVTFVTGLHREVIPLVWVTLLAAIALLLATDLYLRISRGWRIDWDIVQEKPDPQVARTNS